MEDRMGVEQGSLKTESDGRSRSGAGPPYALSSGALRPSGRVAISNQRLVRLEGEEVSFTWKDYAQGQRLREMTLSGEEFLRRFLLHVLPDRFVRIRYYDLLANRHREQSLALCREILPGLQPGRSSPSPMGSPCSRVSLTLTQGRGRSVGRYALRFVEDLTPQSEPQKEPRASPQ